MNKGRDREIHARQHGNGNKDERTTAKVRSHIVGVDKHHDGGRCWSASAIHATTLHVAVTALKWPTSVIPPRYYIPSGAQATLHGAFVVVVVQST